MKLWRMIFWMLLLLTPTVVRAQDENGGLPRSDVGQILFVQDGSPYVIDGDGTNERRLSELESLDAAAWMSDGNQIVMALGVTLYLMNADGSNSHLLSVHAGDYHTLSVTPSPDGSHVLWEVKARGSINQTLYLVDSVTGDVELLTENSIVGHAYAWSPDGSQMLFNSESDIQVRDISSGENHVLTQGISAAWSPDGTSIALVQVAAESDERARLSLISPDGTEIRQLVEREGLMRELQWSPDSQYIAYIIDRDIENTVLTVSDVQIIAVETGDTYIITPTYLRGSIDSLAWSSDSHQLTFDFSDNTELLINSTLYSVNPADIEFVPLRAECECRLASLSWRP